MNASNKLRAALLALLVGVGALAAAPALAWDRHSPHGRYTPPPSRHAHPPSHRSNHGNDAAAWILGAAALGSMAYIYSQSPPPPAVIYRAPPPPPVYNGYYAPPAFPSPSTAVVGQTVDYLPGGTTHLIVNGRPFYFYNGVYYVQNSWNGFTVVPPPIR